jgi:integrase
MPRRATGSLSYQFGSFHVRVTLDRPRSYVLALERAGDEDEAEARQVLLAGIAKDLRHLPDVADRLLRHAAKAPLADLPGIRRYIDSIRVGERAPLGVQGPGTTMGDLAEEWLSGKLAKRYPDRIRQKRSLAADRSRLCTHILPALGPDGVPIRDVRLVDFTVDHGEAILSAIPEARAAETRRHVARLVVRLLHVAVFPLRLLPASPLPRGWVPPAGPRKALGWIYPDEDRRLLACTLISLGWRLFWGFLTREGPRASEAWSLELPDLDLVRGILTLDKNKTDDPRAWALTPGVPTAIARWLDVRGSPSSFVFLDECLLPIAERDPGYLAARFRGHLRLAGITRAELFEASSSRLAIRAHDLRGTFVTLASANGKSEAWIMDRTGHGTSGMLNRYRRAIRTAAELGLGELDPLDQAIPELRGGPAVSAPGNSSAIGRRLGEGCAVARGFAGPEADPRMAMSAIRFYQGWYGSSCGTEAGFLAASAQMRATCRSKVARRAWARWLPQAMAEP